MATELESEVRNNGVAEINGHAPANGVPASAECLAESKLDETATPNQPADANHNQNHEAFAKNQDIADESETKPDDKLSAADAEAKSSHKEGEIVKGLGEGASGSSPAEQSDEKTNLDEMAVDKVEGTGDAVMDKGKETAKEPERCEQAGSSAKDEPSPGHRGDPPPVKDPPGEDPPTKDSVTEPPVDSSADAAPPADFVDVDMTDAPALITDNFVANQVSAAEAEETNTQESALSTAADSSHNSPTAPATADTSMSDLVPTKLSREREDDDAEQPSAKRAKTDPTNLDDTQVPATGTDGAMDVDTSAAGADTSLYLEDGQPKPLGHRSLDLTPITEWQNRQLRSVLAGVKKTKGGMNFRAPVQTLWPGLWAEYSIKISEPMDLSTMEKKLRKDLPSYPNMEAFKQDLDLVVRNAVTFNGELHEITQAAKNTRESVLERMKGLFAAEPPKPERKETMKQLPKRNAEPRVQAQPPPPPPKPAKAAPPPVEKVIPESPVFAIPPNNNGVPVIRRDSTKTSDNRPKRPVNPPKSKDLIYENRKRKKPSPEIKFCEVVLEELRKAKHFAENQFFQTPVDPVALNIPNYYKVIKKPMDMQTMTNKLANGDYSNTKEFEKDFNLMIKNARDYNGEGHTVTLCGIALQKLFQEEWKRKDEFVAKLAPASHAATSPRQRDDSEDDDADSETEAGRDDAKSSDKLNYMLKRLADEQAKVNREMESLVPDSYAVEVTQDIINNLQKSIIQERQKLMEETSKAKPKSKTARSKKAGGASGVAAGPSKRAAGGAKRPGGGKRAAAKRKINPLEKEVIAHGISDLDGPQLERAIDIIKKDTGQGENDSGELELDIEVLSNDALVRLYDIVTRAFPDLLSQKERDRGLVAEPAADVPSSPAAKTKATKSKKNKPMSKTEQERRIAQLSHLRAAAQRQGSGSQEPMESIEGNGLPQSAISETAPPVAQDSADEESSEEE